MRAIAAEESSQDVREEPRDGIHDGYQSAMIVNEEPGIYAMKDHDGVSVHSKSIY